MTENGSSKVQKRQDDADVGDAKDSAEEKGRRLRSQNIPSDLPTVQYKEGEPVDFPKHFNPKTEKGSMVKVVIPADSLSNTNKQVKSRQIWGNGVYTNDSDLVAILMHMGYYSHVLSSPPSGVTEAHVVVSTQPVQKEYVSKCRNSIRSRNWCGNLEGCSIKVEKCWLVTRQGSTVELQAAVEGLPAIAPTFMPAAMERVMHTRSSASSVERRQRMKQEVTVQYNLCNEPWLKYTMGAVADQGLQPSQWTSARMHSEALYLETHRTRYELSRRDTGSSGSDGDEEEQYRWAQCFKPLPLSKMKTEGVPLPEAQLKILEPSLHWEEFQWCPSGLYVKGVHYPIVRLHFMRLSQPST